MSKKKKLILTIVSILVVLLGAAGVYGFNIYQSLKETTETMHTPIERVQPEKRPEKVTLEKKDPFSVLLMGVDKRENDSGRSDTMVVLTVNPNTNSVKMLSIPRDTRVEIIGRDTEDKINHAYAFGGVAMSMATIENFLDIPIDYYIEINMEGFKDIVDAVGGVEVNNAFAFNYEGYTFEEGTLQLSGEEALAYSRMRYEDPNGDFGRQQRQRQIISAIIKKGASLSSLWNYSNIFDALGANVKTNLTFEEMVDIQRNYGSAAKNIEQYQIAGNGQMINSIYYYMVSDEERARLQDLLRQHLELD
ncbi:LytR family transcriptional attenuator [Bacillus oleivorans]|uniref:Polyisoprenyl-teichoic acid--peptidoglycan teichoic acid transferase TagU n=1 Tax=Bacillus oleivorans TaxID=1448271 RepID=A0A285CHK6_9BACI|nr:LytR family transcriptional regulator [Bacillus oleivorans]SNX67071.1 LytR family transcriptional attenuator [Bacillus oleivorans]